MMLAVGGYIAYGILFPNPYEDFVGEWTTNDETQSLVFTEQGDCVYRLGDYYFSIPVERLDYANGRISFTYWNDYLQSTQHLIAELDQTGNIELRPYAKSSEAVTFARSSAMPNLALDLNDLPEQVESVKFDFAAVDVIRPKPGYVWQPGQHVTMKTDWKPGLQDPQRGVVSDQIEGEWQLLPGYAWDTSKTSGLWSPGIEHPSYSGVVASTNAGKWRLARGYAWAGESGLATVASITGIR